jgi:anti-anti-sigma factor
VHASRPPDPPPFGCDVIPERDHVRVVPVGELDMAAAPVLDRTIRELRDAGFDYLIVDLRQLRFLDSSGLRLLMDLSNAANADSHRLELVPGPAEVQRVFEISGTLAALPFRPADPS